MEHEPRTGIVRVEPRQRTSRAVIHNGTVYLGGQVATATVGGTVREQTKEALAAVDDLLEKAGTDKSRVLRATVYLADVSTFEEMNSVWDEWIVPGHKPARATVGALLAYPELKVEIVVTAAV